MLEFDQRPLEPNELFELKYVHDARQSPDGRYVAYLTSRTEEDAGQEFFEIVIEELGIGVRRELKFPGRPTCPRWSPAGTLLAFVGSEGTASRLYLTDAEAREISPLTPSTLKVQEPFSWSPDGSTIAYTVVTYSSPSIADPKSVGIRRITSRLFRYEGGSGADNPALNTHLVNVQNRVIHPLDLGMTVSMQPAFSPCGKRILFVGSDTPAEYSVTALRGMKLFTLDLTDGHVVKVLDDPWMISGAAWSPCGNRIVFAGAYGSQLTVPNMALWVINRDGSDPQCRTEGVGNVGLRFHHDMPTFGSESSIFLVPDAAHAYATVTTSGCGEIWRIGLDGALRCEPVVSGRRSCLIMDANAKTSKLLYCASDLNSPWDLYQSNLDGGNERRLTSLNDAVLARWPALKVEHLEFESGDGLSLEGWYLARADREGPQPTVMFVHGGPFHATGHSFRFDFRLLAANGFAVLLANFRGSTGYGESFSRAIMGDWGARAFPDHIAAVDAAVSRGLADPARLGVWGPSHGGLATCWIVCHTTRFRAAVAESAVTNFTTHYYLTDATKLFVYDLGGRPDEIPDVYRSRSPLTYAWRCRTPTLMVHGEDDLRVPIAEAEQFYRALHDTNCVTEMVRIPGMNHAGAVTGPLHARRGQNEALLDWFERYL